jgi:membrane protein insertase Oxa1/YidC/SpoIIIJ
MNDVWYNFTLRKKIYKIERMQKVKENKINPIYLPLYVEINIFFLIFSAKNIVEDMMIRK